jgi:prophage tail gpP-like protein
MAIVGLLLFACAKGKKQLALQGRDEWTDSDACSARHHHQCQFKIVPALFELQKQH